MNINFVSQMKTSSRHYLDVSSPWEKLMVTLAPEQVWGAGQVFIRMVSVEEHCLVLGILRHLMKQAWRL